MRDVIVARYRKVYLLSSWRSITEKDAEKSLFFVLVIFLSITKSKRYYISHVTISQFILALSVPVFLPQM